MALLPTSDIFWHFEAASNGRGPSQVSPKEDDGYDISDFYHIDPASVTMADFKHFVAAASQRNIKVIIDLVLNHTSDKHPWFLHAKQDSSTYHNWYVWSKEKPTNKEDGVVFKNSQQETWSFDSAANAYYYHRFYKFEPDLNTQNPQVKNEMFRVMNFW